MWGYEYCDILRRVIEKYSILQDESVEFHQKPSTLNNIKSFIFFIKKWKQDDNKIKRCLEEEKYNYELNCKETNINL